MKILTYIIIFYLLFFTSCTKNIALTQSHILIKSELKDSLDWVFAWYDNRFGERVTLHIHDTAIVTNVLPSILFVGGNNFIHQPILVNSNKKIVVKKIVERHFFDKSVDSCMSNLLERAETEFGFCHFPDFLSRDIEMEEFAEVTNTNQQLIRGLKYNYKEQISFVDDYRRNCKISKRDYYYLKAVLQDFYKIKVIISSIKVNVDTLTNSNQIKKELKKLSKSVFNRLDCKYPTSLHAQKLVYIYNRLLCKSSLNTLGEFSTQWESSKLNYKGKSKEFLQFILLKKYVSKNVVGFDNYLNEFHSTCKHKDYATYIDSLVSLEKHIFNKDELDTPLKDTTQNILTFSDILKQNKGSIIYLDFWASWCMPCREEFGEYPKFGNFFDDNKVKPILISIDENENAWKSAIEKTNAKFRTNYLIKKDSPLAQFFKVSPIPRYVLIDKNGNISQFTASRLSNKYDLIKQISTIAK